MANNKASPHKRKSSVRDSFTFLSYLQSISPRRQKLLIKGADRPNFQAFSELCLNLIKKNIKLSAQQIDKLRPYEEEIYQLSLRKHGVEKRKKLIQSGGLLSALLSAVLPVLISSVVAATSK